MRRGTAPRSGRRWPCAAERNDEWWRGYRDGRWDRDDAEQDEGHEVDPRDYIWAGGQPIGLSASAFAYVDDDEEVDWDDLQEEWAELDETDG